MQRTRFTIMIVVVLTMAASAGAVTPAGDAQRGAQLYRACAACHSLAPDQNMTGPSLAGILNRKAGTLESFERYSPALKASRLVWDGETLDEWLKAPADLIPGNRMTFAGIPDIKQRANLIAFLKEASAGRSPTAPSGQGEGKADTMAGMAAQSPNLKELSPAYQVRAIRYCHDTYHVTTADGKTADYWERNLRFKTDSGDDGPLAGTSVVLPAGMMGDRASIIFSSPADISSFIKHQC